MKRKRELDKKEENKISSKSVSGQHVLDDGTDLAERPLQSPGQLSHPRIWATQKLVTHIGQ